MKLQIAKWGNSLAVRLPMEFIRATGLKEGDSVEAEIGLAGEITLTPAHPFAFRRLTSSGHGDRGWGD